MSWVDKAHKKNKIHKTIDAAMKDPRYQMAEKKKIQDATQEVFDRFILISTDYLHRHCRYGKKRLLNFIEFAVYQVKCIETDPEYFDLLNGALMDETGLNILENLGMERRKAGMKLIDIDDFLKFMESLEAAGAEYVSFDDLRKFVNEQSSDCEREIEERLKHRGDTGSVS